jgi:hypothetical protein
MATPNARFDVSTETRASARPRGVIIAGHERGLGDACARAGQMMRDNPASSALATFGVGVAIGSALVFVLGHSRRRPSWREQAQASGGHLRDMVVQLLPDALSRHMSK